jgi:DNA repair exonuclease SbcCD nuclease subunit
VLHGAVTVEAALAASINPGDLDLMLRKFLYAAGDGEPTEEGEMAESVSDFSKILELQEVKKHYDDLQERVRMEMSEKDDEIDRLRRQLAEASLQPVGENVEAIRLRQENERLSQQLQSIRQEYEAKIERLNSRVRELSTGAPAKAPEPAVGERRGFFRR